MGAAPSFTDIGFACVDGVATMTLNRPAHRNALSIQMRKDMEAACDWMAEQEDVRVLIITGAGEHFCAGGDVKAQHARSQDASVASPAAAGRARMRRDHPKISKLLNLDIPVITAVDGAAAGAGFSLALYGDFIIATERAYFLMAFGRLGLVPDWYGAYMLPKLIGVQKAKELIFSARRMGAQEAESLGLLYQRVPNDGLLAAAQALAQRLKQASPEAIALAKRMIDNAFLWDRQTALEVEALSQATARSTPYHREAVRRFVAKEAPLLDWR